MKIAVKNKSQSNGIVFVRRISWRERCEEQLNEIIKELKEIKKSMEDDVSKIKEYAEKVYGEEYPDLTEEK